VGVVVSADTKDQVRRVLAFRPWHRWLPCSWERFREFVTRAMGGDVDAVASAVLVLNNGARGHFALIVCMVGAPIEVRREVLTSVWNHDHRHLLAACRSPKHLRRLFRDAEFPLPSTASTLTVFRGTSALSLDEARRGWAWTLDRDVACWFAMRFAAENGRPLVLRAEVPRDRVFFYSNDRTEAEVLLDLDEVPGAVDGEPSEWAERHASHSAVIRARNNSFAVAS
jgi:hypothetical protein